MINNLKEIEPKLKDSFYELRNFMYETLKNFGRDTGEDGKIFFSMANGQTTKKMIDDNRRDKDADYTIKENMLPKEKLEKIETLSADKGYDSEEIIKCLKDNEIIPIIDIQNKWKNGEKTKQYKDTNIIYTYDGYVYYVDEDGKEKPMKYMGYDKVKDKLRYEYKGRVYGIEISADERIFTPIARSSKKWQRIYNKRTALERINGRFDRDFNLENNRVRGLAKATIMIDIMMIGMLAMAKEHIINNNLDKIRKLKST